MPVEQITKGDLINDALSKMAINGIVVPPEVSDISLATRRLEMIMYRLRDNRDMDLGYNFTARPNPSDRHRLQFNAFDPISSFLAVSLLGDYKLPVPPTLDSQSSAGMSELSGYVLKNQIQQVQYPARAPRGSGTTQKYIRWRSFHPEPQFIPVNVVDQEQMQIGEIDDFTEDFTSYLRNGETLLSVEAETTGGIRLVSSNVVGNRYNYRIEALSPTVSFGDEEIVFTATTTLGRIDKIWKGFKITQ